MLKVENPRTVDCGRIFFVDFRQHPAITINIPVN
jgi:hypothetical protein